MILRPRISPGLLLSELRGLPSPERYGSGSNNSVFNAFFAHNNPQSTIQTTLYWQTKETMLALNLFAEIPQLSSKLLFQLPWVEAGPLSKYEGICCLIRSPELCRLDQTQSQAGDYILEIASVKSFRSQYMRQIHLSQRKGRLIWTVSYDQIPL
jgi:hypothetical protein